MKKIILFTLAIFAAFFCFAKEDEKVDNKAFVINLGDTFYNTKRLNDISGISEKLNSNGFTAELGVFGSDEDGLFDVVNFSLFGFGTGKIFDIDDYSWTNDNIFYSKDGDARYYNFYVKSTFGIQMNAIVLSLGVTTGPKIGFDAMHMDVDSSRDRNVVFHENRLFFDWVVNPYVSLNFKKVKVFAKTDFDFPVLRVNFDYYKGNHYKSETKIDWDWFKNDIPISYMVGCAIFFD